MQLTCNCILEHVRTAMLWLVMIILIVATVLAVLALYYTYEANLREAGMTHGDSRDFLNGAAFCDKKGDEARYGNRGFINCIKARNLKAQNRYYLAMRLTCSEFANAFLPSSPSWTTTLLLMSSGMLLLSLACVVMLVYMFCIRGSGRAMVNYHIPPDATYSGRGTFSRPIQSKRCEKKRKKSMQKGFDISDTSDHYDDDDDRGYY